MKRVNELLALAVERSTEQFPHRSIEPIAAYWSCDGYRCSLWVNNALAFGYGKSINECCDSLLASILKAKNSENAIIHELL
jgi:hypothetical protein